MLEHLVWPRFDGLGRDFAGRLSSQFGLSCMVTVERLSARQLIELLVNHDIGATHRHWDDPKLVAETAVPVAPDNFAIRADGSSLR